MELCLWRAGAESNDRGVHESINGFRHWSTTLQLVQSLRSFS
jgi:hypothetical protein